MPKISNFSSNIYEGEVSPKLLKHLLNRTLFGATGEDIAYFEGQSLEQVINELISKSPAPAPPINYYQTQYEDPTNVKEGETWIYAPYGDGDANFRRRQSLRYWWIQNMWFQKRTIEEKMILFWHNHFATQIEVYDNAKGAYKYQNTLRTHALGNFKEFVKAITIEPAMLEYLNGQRNSKESPDENYARELQELFTLGKGEKSNYTEEDVRAAARILTGHRYDWETQTYNFNSQEHDQEDKQFSSFYKNRIIKGLPGFNGSKELDELLDMIFENEELSFFIVRKLYHYFLHYDINETIEKEFIAPLAKVFRDSNYELKPLLRAFFGSQHFLDDGFYGAQIASPLDLLVRTLRQYNPSLPPLSESIYYYHSMTGVLMRHAEAAQQYIGDPPSVSGWPAYYQSPLFNQMWINADTYQKRSIFIAVFFYKEIKRGDYILEPDLFAFIQKMADPRDPTKLVDDLVFHLLPLELSSEVKQQIKKDILLSGQENDFYWTELWDSYKADPSNSETKAMVYQRIQFLLFYLHSLPEYQLQ